MRLLLILAACATLGAGLTFEQDTRYKLDLKNAEEPVYGVFLRQQGKAIMFRLESPLPDASIGPKTFQADDIEDKVEVTEDEWSELQKEARERRGDKLVQTASGSVWVSQLEFDLAQRATQMAEERLQRSKPPVVEEVPQTAPPPAAEPAPAPGFLKLWGGHIILLGVAAVLIGAVAKFMVVGSE